MNFLQHTEAKMNFVYLLLSLFCCNAFCFAEDRCVVHLSQTEGGVSDINSLNSLFCNQDLDRVLNEWGLVKETLKSISLSELNVSAFGMSSESAVTLGFPFIHVPMTFNLHNVKLGNVSFVMQDPYDPELGSFGPPDFSENCLWLNKHTRVLKIKLRLQLSGPFTMSSFLSGEMETLLNSQVSVIFKIMLPYDEQPIKIWTTTLEMHTMTVEETLFKVPYDYFNLVNIIFNMAGANGFLEKLFGLEWSENLTSLELLTTEVLKNYFQNVLVGTNVYYV